MKCSDYVAQFLAQNTDYAFGVTGGRIINVIDSIYRQAGITFIPMNHEQGSAIAADAYGRFKPLGVCVATSGPGATNLLTGVMCAHGDSTPMLAITGQVPSSQQKIRNGCRHGAMQEADVVRMFAPVCKTTMELPEPNVIRKYLDYAVGVARSGRPGPVLLDICDDYQRADINPDELPTVTNPWDLKTIHRTPHKRAAEADIIRTLLKNSERPILVLGHGVRISGMATEAQELVELLGIPVLLTWGALDVLDHNHPLNFRDFGITGSIAGNKIIQNADCILALGTRFDPQEIGAKCDQFAPDAMKIVAEIDHPEIARFEHKDNWHVVQADLRDLIPALLGCCTPIVGNEWLKWCNSVRGIIPFRPSYTDGLCPYEFIYNISVITPDDVIIVTDAGCTVTWTMQAWQVKQGQRLFTSFNQSPMGYAVPAAIGAHYATRKKVICITGDGGLLMNAQELSIISQRELPIRIFVMNNRGYGMIQQTQDTWLDSRYYASKDDLCLPSDVAALAQGYDLQCRRIDSLDDISKYVTGVHGPLMLDVHISPKARIIPRIRYGEKLEEIR